MAGELAAEWIKIPDGNGNLQKVWIRDSQARRDIAALPGKTIPYGYCTTAAATVAKTVTVSPAVTALASGLTIAVKFQYANTSTSPTLDVNSLGAVAIKRYGTTAAGTSAASSWNANSVMLLIYDGTYWMLVDWVNTTYSGMTDAEYQAGTGTSNRLITPARLKAAILYHAPVDSVNGQTGAVSLDASDVGALPDSTTIPSKTSQLTNDSGFITASAVPNPSSAVPVMDGTAAAGSSDDYARADHVHPSDTTKQDAATRGALTFNDTSYNQTYIDSASGSWERIGNIIVFNLTYKMKSSISSYLANAISGFPNCPITAHFLSESTLNDVAARHVTVSGNMGTIAGAHSGGTTYYAAGAYLTS